MATHDSDRSARRVESGVMDAIFETVEGAPAKDKPADSRLFRAKALEQIDVARQLDNLLPVTSRRFWIALIGLGLVIVAALVYTAGVVQTTSVTAVGRAVAPSGIAQAASPTGGVLTGIAVSQAQDVKAGVVVATGVRADGTPLQVLAPVSGQIWQLLATSGQVVHEGELVATVLPNDGGNSVLLPLTESMAQQVRAGMTVEISGGFGFAIGQVMSVSSAPIPASSAAKQVDQPLDEGSPIIMVTVTTDADIPAGAAVTASIIISRETLLAQLTALR